MPSPEGVSGAPSVLTDGSDAALGAAVEENLYALFRAMATLPGSALHEEAVLSYHLAPPPNPMFKGVWRTRLTPEAADAAIDETLAWFKGHNAPFLFWWTGPETTPADLGARLVARGLLDMEGQAHQLAVDIRSTAAGAPGMAADLRALNEAALTQVPAGFTSEEVRDEAALLDFRRVLVAGYDLPEPVAHGWVDAAQRAGIGSTPWRMYVGRLEGKPVATSMVFLGGGVAGVYSVATVPEARRKGIGGAITLAPLLEARDAGYRYAVLFATESGVGTYERIGFRRCGVRINRYLWRNA